MNLNKDSQDIYTADSESYSGYMQENRKESKDLLSFLIKSLLVILFFVLSYFSYKIVKADLSFSEVFNTDEISDDSLRVEFEEPEEVVALAVTQKYIEPVVEKKEIVIEKEVAVVEESVVEIEKLKKVKVAVVRPEIILEKVVIEEEIVEIEKPKDLVRVEEIKEKKIVESVPVETLTTKEITDETTLSDSYLELMAKELDSL